MQHILPTANVLTVFTWKPSVGIGSGHAESVNPQDWSDRNCFCWLVGTTKGSFLLAMGTPFGLHPQSYPSINCLFSPKPHFVYKWWLYVKTFRLSSNQCLGSFLLDTCTLTLQTYTQHTLLNCLVHCNMNWVFLLQSKFEAFIFQSELCVMCRWTGFCHVIFNLHTVQHGDARPAVYMISRVFEHVDRL